MTIPVPRAPYPAHGLRAVRLALGPGPAIDPFRLAGPSDVIFDDGAHVMVGTGSALTIPLPRGIEDASDLAAVGAVLRAIECHDEVGPTGSAIVAFGALPFDRSEPATLVVPEVTYGCSADGSEWVSVVAQAQGAIDDLFQSATNLRTWVSSRFSGTTDASSPAAAASQAAAPSRDRRGPVAPAGPFVIDPLTTDAHFLGMVTDAVGAIDRGELTKVVLARQVDVHTQGPLDVSALLRRWRTLEPNCTIFAMPMPQGQFIGASPELLIERRGHQVTSRPLAGTSGRAVNVAGGGGGADRDSTDPVSSTEGEPTGILGSSKDAVEHRIVVEAIGRALGPLCSDIDVPLHPDLVHLRSVTHLGTTITGRLRADDTEAVPDALALAALLHPTPAVGGVPLAAALDTIARLESPERGRYAGPVGYVNAAGDGEWFVGIRAATVSGAIVRLAAGVGIVDGSEPDAELRETQLKFTAVFDALAPGEPFSTTARRAG